MTDKAPNFGDLVVFEINSLRVETTTEERIKELIQLEAKEGASAVSSLTMGFNRTKSDIVGLVLHTFDDDDVFSVILCEYGLCMFAVPHSKWKLLLRQGN